MFDLMIRQSRLDSVEPKIGLLRRSDPTALNSRLDE